MNKHLFYSIGAFVLWGIFPIYFKQLSHIPALDVAAHRIIWAFLMLAIVLRFKQRFINSLKLAFSKKYIFYLILSSILISINWFTFVYAVEKNEVLQASFGYFASPLFNVLLGLFLFKEKFSVYKVIALSLMIISIIVQSLGQHSTPYISITLAITFALYSAVKKKIDLSSIETVMIETLLMVPLSMIIIFKGPSMSINWIETSDYILLVLAGLMTLIPLVLFSKSVQGLDISTVGFIQYIAPSLQFLAGYVIYNEPANTEKLISFALIWLACAVLVLSNIFLRKQTKSA